MRKGIPTFKAPRLLSRLGVCNRKTQSRTDATPFHTTLRAANSSDWGET